MQRRFTTSDGVGIAYDVHPHGNRWLVLLHGAGGDRTAWKHERTLWHQRGYATLAIDLRGHGLSDRPTQVRAYKLDRFAADVHELLRAERVADPIMIGHCFGGIVAMMAHQLEPSIARAYVLIDTTDRAPALLEAVADHTWFRWLVGELLVHADLAQHHFHHVNFDRYAGTGDWNWSRIASDISSTGLASWLATFATLSEFDGRQILATMDQPVLVIEGSNDSIFDLALAKRIQRELPRAELELIPGQNHIIVLTDSVDIASAVQEFVERLPIRQRLPLQPTGSQNPR